MSNNLMKMGNSLPAEMIEQMAARVAADLARLGGTGDKDQIRITQDKKFQFPDETLSDGPLDLVIVDFVYRNEYYPGVYNRKEITPPTCIAISPEYVTLTPSPKSPKMQVEEGALCSKCRWDAFGSSPQGDGKACKNTVFMAVLQSDAAPDSPLLVVKVSPTALRFFNQHVAKIGRQANLAVNAVVTELSFEKSLAYPSLRFDILNLNPIFELTNERAAEARARLLQLPDFTGVATE